MDNPGSRTIALPFLPYKSRNFMLFSLTLVLRIECSIILIVPARFDRNSSAAKESHGTG